MTVPDSLSQECVRDHQGPLEVAARIAGLHDGDGFIWAFNSKAGMFRTDHQYSKVYQTWNPIVNGDQALSFAVEHGVLREHIGMFWVQLDLATASGAPEPKATRLALVQAVVALTELSAR